MLADDAGCAAPEVQINSLSAFFLCVLEYYTRLRGGVGGVDLPRFFFRGGGMLDTTGELSSGSRELSSSDLVSSI